MAYLTQISTSTLSNQNISSALLIHTFTNTTRIRKLWVNVFIDQVAGNGDYIAHITIQRAGAGSEYTSIKTTLALASGVTSGYFGSIPITLNATDVLKVYVIGLAGDTTTVDTITDVNEEWENIDASGNTVLSGVTHTGATVPTVTTLTNAPTDMALDSTVAKEATLSTVAGYIDTEVAAVKAKTDNLPASPAAVGSAMALTSDERNSVADALLDRSAGIETGITFRQAMRIALAVLAGKLSGAATTTITIRDVNDTNNRVVATVDSDGNRTAVTLDAT